MGGREQMKQKKLKVEGSYRIKVSYPWYLRFFVDFMVRKCKFTVEDMVITKVL